ncbi:MAG: carbonic anhydrase [Candidatus Aureabacteria bacterium]|nr:carbonic anhydrase [Candidatus Auribacterota bacterium]
MSRNLPCAKYVVLQLGCALAISMAFASCTFFPFRAPLFTHAPSSPDAALQQLMAGNRRYAADKAAHPRRGERHRIEVEEKQKPFAAILGCVDSRVPPEIVFDQGLGDLLVIRIGGPVLDNAVVGSLEFCVETFHIPLLMVLGHSNCGAVKATIAAMNKDLREPGQIGTLIEDIRPAVDKARGQSGDLLDNAVNANVELIIDRLKKSPVLSAAMEKGVLKIVGARYDLSSGKVEIIVP